MVSLFGEAKHIGESALVSGLKSAMHHGGWGAAAGAGLTALFSEWDHHQEKQRITTEYENEIGAIVGKSPDQVRIGDMERVAKGNSVIAEAVNRSTKKRNFSIGATLVATAAALALGALAIFPGGVALIPGIVGAMGLSGTGAVIGETVLGAGLFYGLEKAAEKIGGKIFGMEEVEQKDVARNPALFGKMSVSRQINYLENVRRHGGNISQEQVMTVFATANPGLDAQIKAQHGAHFADLNARAKNRVLAQYGEQLHIAEYAEEINSRSMRVQELAFAANGQSSGAVRFDSPRVRALQQRVDELSAQLNGAGGRGQGVAFSRSGVRGAVIGQSSMQDVGSRRGVWTDRVLAARQQQGQLALG